jgi:hypothetical protein
MYQLRGSGLGWLEHELDFSSTHLLSRRTSKQKLSSWKMSQDFYQATRDAISESSLLAWPTQGIATSNGVFLIRSSSESPNVAVVSSLSQVLQTSVSPKYSLSAKAASGILRRAERRGKLLPEALRAALQKVVQEAEAASSSE